MWKEKKQIAKQSIFTSMNMNNKFIQSWMYC